MNGKKSDLCAKKGTVDKNLKKQKKNFKVHIANITPTITTKIQI